LLLARALHGFVGEDRQTRLCTIKRLMKRLSASYATALLD
jgi:hypothetical protein